MNPNQRKLDEDILFTQGQLQAVRRCNIKKRIDGGHYSEICMSQAIAKLGGHLENVEREREVTTYSYEKFCVRNKKAASFFSHYIWNVDAIAEHKSGQSEEEILLNIELLRRSQHAVKKRLFNKLKGASGFELVFVSWWNYALLRILDLSYEKNFDEKSLSGFTAMRIMTSLFDFMTKDLVNILHPGSFNGFHKHLGVDWIENVNNARRVMDHCNIMDEECSAVEAHIEYLKSQPGPSSSQAREQLTAQTIPQQSAVAGATVAAVPPGSIKTLYYEAPVFKPLLPGIADDSGMTASTSICHPLTYASESSEEDCTICLCKLVALDERNIPVCLKTCGHKFHLQCLRDSMKQQCSYRCPLCRLVLPPPEDRIVFLRGDMPGGKMMCAQNSISCAGYEGCGSIVITYLIHSSHQRSYHPNPGQYHASSWRNAYLPDNREGQELLCRLGVAFLCGLTFTVGTSLTTNIDNSIIWASIHHKTSRNGGAAHHGYPDNKYLSNCNAELDAVGVPSFERCIPHVRILASYLQMDAVPAAPIALGLNESTFYERNVRSVFTMAEGSQTCHLSSTLDWVCSREFIRLVEQSQIVHPVVELNPHLHESKMYQDFVEEGFNCSSDGDYYDVRVVFHGTPESNIESILCNGLDPTLRKRQAYGQGEYFARNVALPVHYCRGGMKILVFAVITTEADNRDRDIIVVKRRQRQLPIATLSFVTVGSSALDAAGAFQAKVSRLLKEKIEKEKLANEAKAKEKIIQRIIETEYEAASDIYKKACGNDGKPPDNWAEEVALYVRDHIRDDVFVEIYFPNLPPRPINSRSIQTLNSRKCEVEAQVAKQAFEKFT